MVRSILVYWVRCQLKWCLGNLLYTLEICKAIWEKGDCTAESMKGVPGNVPATGWRFNSGSPFALLECFFHNWISCFSAHLGLCYLSKSINFGYGILALIQTLLYLQYTIFRIFTLVPYINLVKRPAYSPGYYRQGFSLIWKTCLGRGMRYDT